MYRTLCDVLRETGAEDFSWPPAHEHFDDQSNRVQNQGFSFEILCKDLLSGVNSKNYSKRNEIYSKELSYLGSKNHPPDAMLRGGNSGDAFEIKKSKRNTSELQINSSYPYSHLEPGLARIASAARNSEQWTRRDLHYMIGDVDANSPSDSFLWIVHGEIIAAHLDFYSKFEEKIRKSISQAVSEIGGKVSQSRELGRLNGVDPLGHSNLRIRGMWLLRNPGLIFESLEEEAGFTRIPNAIQCLISSQKWHKLIADSTSDTRKYWKSPNRETTLVQSVQVRDPTITTTLIDAIWIQTKFPGTLF